MLKWLLCRWSSLYPYVGIWAKAPQWVMVFKAVLEAFLQNLTFKHQYQPLAIILMVINLMRQIKAILWQCAKCFAIEMASSFDSDFDLLRLPRRHSWPEAVQTLRPSTSGIFDPLPDQEEIALRSSMTSRTSNHSMGSCIYLL